MQNSLRKMKVAFIVGEFPKLSETFILNQITGLIDRGHEVDIYANCPAPGNKVHLDVVSYKLLERTHYFAITGNKLTKTLRGIQRSALNFWTSPALLARSWNKSEYDPHNVFMRSELPQMVTQFLKRPKYDIIHCHFGENGLKGLMLKQVGAVEGRLVTTFHGYDISQYVDEFGDHIYDSLFKSGDLCCSISDRMCKQLTELGCSADKVKVHRVGINCAAFAFKPRHWQPDSPIRLISICRLVEKKGIEYAIRAVAKLANVCPHISYTIVGDGPLMADLQNLVVQLNVSSVVHLVGWKQHQEVVELLQDAHVLVAPSVTSRTGDKEGIPVSIMEGMAMGLPIIGTYHSGIPELVKDGTSGFLVPERDAEALANKLEYLIRHTEIWPKMGLLGRKHVEQNHNIERLNDQLQDIYENLM